MPAPTYAFTTIADADIDPDSPLTSSLVTAIRNNIVNVDEQVSYGYTRARAHIHDGVDSALISPVIGGNLVACSSPDDSNNSAWIKSAGVSVVTDGGMRFDGASGRYMYQDLPNGRDPSKPFTTVWGTGGDFVVSFFMKSAGAQSVGDLRFGLSDGSTSAFLTGCRATVNSTDCATTDKRFWFTVSSSWTISNMLRMLFYTQTGFTDSFDITGIMVHQGTRLMHYNWSAIEDKDNERAAKQGLYVGGWRVFDKATAMTNAVKLTPV